VGWVEARNPIQILQINHFYLLFYMSAKDIFHQSVRIALEKDGWKITHDPLYLKVNDVEFYIDLGVERLIAAEKAGQKIAIEIKSFLGASEVAEFHLALGQILNYRLALKQEKLARILYLAIPKDTYEDFFSRQFIQDSVAEYQIKLLIFDSIKQEVVLWKE
jgi:hypothetical protein